MPAWTLQFLASLVTSLVVSVFTAVLTVQLSLRRFQAERWWERKVDAYSRIIEALHHVMAFNSMVIDEMAFGNQFSKEHKAEIKSSYDKAQRDLQLAIDVGAYVISDDIAKILTELKSRPKKDENDEKDDGYDKEDEDDGFETLAADLDRYPKARKARSIEGFELVEAAEDDEN
jgi:hypothetical protein